MFRRAARNDRKLRTKKLLNIRKNLGRLAARGGWIHIPYAEQLEDRRMLAYTATLAGTTATMMGDGGNDTLVFSQMGGFLMHNRATAGDPGFNSDLDFDTTQPGDQMLSVAATSTVNIATGGGNDFVTIGTLASPASTLLATFQITNTGANGDQLIVDDSGSATPNAITLASNSVTGTGINVTYTGDLLNGGVTVATGSQDDTVNVQSAASPVNVNTGDGNDTINVGSAGNSLDDIVSPVTVVGGAGGDDVLNVNDQGDVDLHTYTIAPSTISRAGAGNIISDNTTERRIVNGGGANNIYNITGVSVGASLNAGGGDDTFNFADGAALGGAIDGAGGTDALNYSAYMTPVAVNLGATSSSLIADLEGVQVIPATTTMASGSADITYDSVTKTFDITVNVSGIAPADVTGFHLHRAPFGVNGPMIIDFGVGSLVPDGAGGFTFMATGVVLDPLHEAAFLGGLTYIDVKTAAFPGGVLRGQVFPNVVFTAAPGTATGTTGVSNVENVTGGSGSFMVSGTLFGDSIVGNNDDNNLQGGPGNDVLVAARGNDTVSGGADNDILVWSNGDGTDTMDGDAGADLVQVNGAVGAADSFFVSAGAGGRVNFQRTDPGPFGLDIGATETLTVNGIGGGDSFFVNPLVGVADLTVVNVNGLDGNDTFFVNPAPTVTINVNGHEPSAPGAPGDILNYFGNGADTPSGVGSGTISQVGFQNVNYTEIEHVVVADGVIVVPTPTGLNVTVLGDRTAPNQNDTFEVALDATGQFVEVRRNGNVVFFGPKATAPANIAAVAQLNIFGAGGDDELIVDSSNGLVNIFGGIHFNGNDAFPGQMGAGSGGFDRLTLTQTGGDIQTSDVLSPGATPGSGRSTIEGPSGIQTVSFTGLEPIVDDVPAATFEIAALPGLASLLQADNAINYSAGEIMPLADRGRITVDEFEPIEFSNKTSLIISAGSGSDTINLNNPMTPASLTEIIVNGGDPTASDTVIVTGTAAPDVVTIDQLTLDGARIQGLGPVINVTTAEHLVYSGQGGNDSLTITTPAGGDRINFIPGASASEAVVLVSTAANAPLLPIDYVDIGILGNVILADEGGARDDSLTYYGTAQDDVFTVAASGEIELEQPPSVGGDNLAVVVQTPGVGEVVLLGLDGDDVFAISGNHPFATGILVEGGNPSASDVVNFTGSGAGAVTVDLENETVQEMGFGAVSLSGAEVVNIDAATANVIVLGENGDDELIFEAQTLDAGRLTKTGLNRVFNLINVGDLTIDGNGGDDALHVHANSADNIIDVSDVAVTFDAASMLQDVNTIANIDELSVFGGNGGDLFNVTPGAIPIFIDGGDPIGVDAPPGDEIVITAVTLFHPGPEPDEGGFETAGAEEVSFDHIERITVMPGPMPGPVVIFGTNGDDDITIIARDMSTHLGADGVQDFTVSVNNGVAILFLDQPELQIDALAGDDNVVLRAPAPNNADWNVDVIITGGPGKDDFTLETPGVGQEAVVFTPTSDDTATIDVTNAVGGGDIADITLSDDILPAVAALMGPPPAVVGGNGGFEQVFFKGESALDGAGAEDLLTIDGTSGDDTTVVSPVDLGAGTFRSTLSPLFDFVGFAALTVNAGPMMAGADGFDVVRIDGTSGPDVVTSTADTVTLIKPITLGPGLNRLEIYTHAGNDNIDLDLDLDGLEKFVDAGAGNDLVNLSGTLDAIILGGDGDDVLFGSPAADRLEGGAGNDVLVGGGGDDIVFGGDGSDTFIWNPGDADDLFEGGEGDDTLAFAGANGTDDYIISSDNGRVLFQRTQGNIAINMGSVENIIANSETIEMSGRNESPPNTITNGGFANFTYNPVTGTFDIRMFVTGLSSPIVDSHIHMNIPGANGPVVVPFGAGFAPVAGGFELTAMGLTLADITPPAGFTAQDVLMEILLGRAYFNVHTMMFPGGEVRGNIIISGPSAGSGGGDSLTVRDLTGTALRTIVFDAGNDAEILAGAPLTDTVTIEGLNTADDITAAVPNVADNNYRVSGLPYTILVKGSDGDEANGDDRDHLIINGNAGDDRIKAQPPLETITRITLHGGAGDDYLSADAVLIGGDGDDTLVGGDGVDMIFGDDPLDPTASGEDTIIASRMNDMIDGGPGFDTIVIRGSNGDDIIDVRQFGATGDTLFYNVDAPDPSADLMATDTITSIEEVRIEARNGRDTIRVVIADELFDNVGASVRMTVDGGDDQATDRLAIVDETGGGALADLSILRQNRDITAGTVEIGPGNPEPFLHVFQGIEFVQIVADTLAPNAPVNIEDDDPATLNRLVVFKDDVYEHNNDRNNATHLGVNQTINLDPTIDPGPSGMPFNLPGDTDWYRVEALVTGTIDFQIFFEQVGPIGGRPGLPGNGNLAINVFDAAGNMIAGFNAADVGDNDRARIPAVQGQVYYFQVVGLNGAINAYDVSVINLPAPTPYDLELDDEPVGDPPPANSDTGRNNNDNITRDNTPTIIFRLDDAIFLNDLPGNDTPGMPLGDAPIPIPFQMGPGQPVMPGYAIAIFDEGDTSLPPDVDEEPQTFLGFATMIEPGVYQFTTPQLSDGSHFLTARVQMIDPAAPGLRATGFGPRSASLEIFVDTTPPPVSFGEPTIATDGLVPDDDTGVSPPNPDTIRDRVTSERSPTFWGRAEANAIVRLFADVNNNNVLDANDVFVGQATAIPLDGNQQEGVPPNNLPHTGFWTIKSVIDFNDPDVGFFPTIDGLRRVFVTAEDVAGNVSGAEAPFTSFEFILDTQGPRINTIRVVDDPATAVDESEYDLFNPKPTQASPTPLVRAITIKFTDLPNRGPAPFDYPALKEDVALDPGHYHLVGDHNGRIAISSVMITQTIMGGVAMAEVTLTFFEPLPDDRFTLTISDAITDPVGNRLDGESNADEPIENPDIDFGNANPMSGDGVPGGTFVGRFTVDSRPEVAVYSGRTVFVDTNGNGILDPRNGLDFSDRDVVYRFGLVTDDLFVGNFATNFGATADGFDKLAAYGHDGTGFRFLIDTNNDGVPEPIPGFPTNTAQINGHPVVGNFDGNLANGDEIGIFDGARWYLDTTRPGGGPRNFNVDPAEGDLVVNGAIRGFGFAGDFDGDGLADLATFNDFRNRFEIDLAAGGYGNIDRVILFGFPGTNERPVAADYNRDGIDDIGLFAPQQGAGTPDEQGFFFILVSQPGPNGAPQPLWLSDRAKEVPVPTDLVGQLPAIPRASVEIHFRPEPFGDDLLIPFGEDFALPLFGNFDPPVGSGVGTVVQPIGDGMSDTNPNNPLDVDDDGEVSISDVLPIVNALRAAGGTFAAPQDGAKPYLDVTADGLVSTADLLPIIRHIKEQREQGSANGEGEEASTDKSDEWLILNTNSDDSREVDTAPTATGRATVATALETNPSAEIALVAEGDQPIALGDDEALQEVEDSIDGIVTDILQARKKA